MTFAQHRASYFTQIPCTVAVLALAAACGGTDSTADNTAPSGTSSAVGAPATQDSCPSLIKASAVQTMTTPITVATATTSGHGSWSNLRTDASYAYWVADTQYFYRAPLSGGAPELIGQLEDSILLLDFVLTDDTLVIRDVDTFYSLPKTGGELTKLYRDSDTGSLSNLRTLVLDGDTLYISDAVTTLCNSSEGRIAALSLTDNSHRIFADGLACPEDLTQDADNIYAVVSGPLSTTDYKQHEASLVRFPKDSGTPVVLETGTYVSRIRSGSGEYVFGLVGNQSEPGSALVRIPKAGGAVEPVLSAACMFSSDYLELVNGQLLYDDGGEMVLADANGTPKRFFTRTDGKNIYADHEGISVQGNSVYIINSNTLLKFDL